MNLHFVKSISGCCFMNCCSMSCSSHSAHTNATSQDRQSAKTCSITRFAESRQPPHKSSNLHPNASSTLGAASGGGGGARQASQARPVTKQAQQTTQEGGKEREGDVMRQGRGEHTCFFCSSLVGSPAAFCRWSYIIFSTVCRVSPSRSDKEEFSGSTCNTHTHIRECKVQG